SSRVSRLFFRSRNAAPRSSSPAATLSLLPSAAAPEPAPIIDAVKRAFAEVVAAKGFSDDNQSRALWLGFGGFCRNCRERAANDLLLRPRGAIDHGRRTIRPVERQQPADDIIDDVNGKMHGKRRARRCKR